MSFSIKQLNADLMAQVKAETSLTNIKLTYPKATGETYPYAVISSRSNPQRYNLEREVTHERVLTEFAVFADTQIQTQDLIEELKEFMRKRGFDCYNTTTVAEDSSTKKYFIQLYCRSIYDFANDSFLAFQ